MKKKSRKKKVEAKEPLEEKVSFKQFFDEAIERKLIPAYTSSRAVELYFVSCGLGSKETRTAFASGLESF